MGEALPSPENAACTSALSPSFEDYKAGDVYQHCLGRTISEVDNTWFTLLTMNTSQNQFSAELAARTNMVG
ncbi:hotdog family protein [Saccharopolyspora pogona]|uniref:hypothetical protein n=1 Tax=Saccharopolyspora pogona TaxID=333966 RepID=UPI001CC26753|nr:hypothetical protein [Saccharopolyspora pogona]